jgi:hypothetical protein
MDARMQLKFAETGVPQESGQAAADAVICASSSGRVLAERPPVHPQEELHATAELGAKGPWTNKVTDFDAAVTSGELIETGWCGAG